MSIAGNVLAVDFAAASGIADAYYNINGLTPLCGTWADLGAQAEIVLVYKQVGTQNVVTQAYVFPVYTGNVSVNVPVGTTAINIEVQIVAKDTGNVLTTMPAVQYTVANGGITAITYLQAATASGVNTNLLNAYGKSALSVTLDANGIVTASTTNNAGNQYGAAGNKLIFQVYYLNS